jgi:MYXO-CTERM domain-containing protein
VSCALTPGPAPSGAWVVVGGLLLVGARLARRRTAQR